MTDELKVGDVLVGRSADWSLRFYLVQKITHKKVHCVRLPTTPDGKPVKDKPSAQHSVWTKRNGYYSRYGMEVGKWQEGMEVPSQWSSTLFSD